MIKKLFFSVLVAPLALYLSVLRTETFAMKQTVVLQASSPARTESSTSGDQNIKLGSACENKGNGEEMRRGMWDNSERRREEKKEKEYLNHL